MKAININGKIKLYGYLPNVWKNIINFSKSSEKVIKQQGFFDVISPELGINEKYGEIYFDKTNKVFTYPIIESQTIDEIYNQKVAQSESIFMEYRNTLVNSSYENVLRGMVTPEFLELVDKLESVKNRIKDALGYYLNNDMVEELLKFNFNTEEAKLLKEEIESFKL